MVDLKKGPKCYEKMHGLGIIQKVQQYLKLVCILWRNCLEFFSFQMNGGLGNVEKNKIQKEVAISSLIWRNQSKGPHLDMCRVNKRHTIDLKRKKL